MCVLQPCENPTQEGVWWRDDTQWCRYTPRHEALIKNGIMGQLNRIDLGKIASSVHPQGARYVVNVQRMEQVAVSSNQQRPIMVIERQSAVTVSRLRAPDEVFSAPRTSLPSLPLRLHYFDGAGNLQRFDSDVEAALLDGMHPGSQRTLLVPDGGSGHYFFDLVAMQQHFISGTVNGRCIFSNQPPVKIIAEVPLDAPAVAMLAVKAEKQLRRKILVLMIERFRSDENLDTLLAERACPRKVISKVSRTCPSSMYEKFVDSLEETFHRLPEDRAGEIMKLVGKDLEEGGPVKIAFKPAERLSGSSARSLKSHPYKAVRSKAAFWVSMAGPVAAAQAVVSGCAVHLKILAYLVIVPCSALSKLCPKAARGEKSGYVEVERPEHGLPLAEVTVC